MSNYPISLDDDTTLPVVYNNITEIGEDAINALRECVINIENELGIGLSGTKGNLADRLAVAFEPDGYLNSMVLIDAGFIVGPVINANVDPNAAIAESKLSLTYSTAALKSLIDGLQTFTTANTNWISNYGWLINNHLNDTSNTHKISTIYVPSTLSYLNNNGTERAAYPNNGLDDLLTSMNNELVNHQKSDSFGNNAGTITTNGGFSFSERYAHISKGLFVDTSGFSFLPQENTDAQSIFDYIDTQWFLVYGARVQNFYTSGIPKSSRTTTLERNDSGVSYSLNDIIVRKNLDGTALTCSITENTDEIEIVPNTDATYYLDGIFNLINRGDVATIFYSSLNIQVDSYILDKQYDSVNRTFKIIVDKLSLETSSTNEIVISKPKFNLDRQGSLFLSKSDGSLLVGNPRAAIALGQAFNPNAINTNYYKLYLEFYPNGNPQDLVVPLRDATGALGFDVSSNLGKSQGNYSLSGIVDTLNTHFRANGVNSRFTAFQYEGNIGIMLTDPYDRASFAIVKNDDGTYTNNIVSDNAANGDALGFGINKANIASLAYYTPTGVPYYPTKVISPRNRNYFYVDGSVLQYFEAEDTQLSDINGDGYWAATVSQITINVDKTNEVVFRVPLDLSSSSLKAGLSVVVLPIDGYYDSDNIKDYGRFDITAVSHVSSPSVYADITVADTRHLVGDVDRDPLSYIVNDQVKLYFCSDTVDLLTSSFIDVDTPVPSGGDSFKFYNEIYSNSEGNLFSYLRARRTGDNNIVIGGLTLSGFSNFSKFRITNISPKFRGYSHPSDSLYECVRFVLVSSSATTGLYSGYLTGYSSPTNGPTITGRVGVPTRFYTEKNSDYIELLLTEAFTGSGNGDIQLFNTLSLNDELLLTGSCEINYNNTINNITDLRTFGNVSEKDLSTSALSYISAYDKYTHVNGVIKGFDVVDLSSKTCIGGTVAINGKIIDVDYNWLKGLSLQASVHGSIPAVYPWWVIAIDEFGNVKTIAVSNNGTDTTKGNISTSSTVTSLSYSGGSVFSVPTRTVDEVLLTSKDCVPLYLYNYNNGTQQIKDIRRVVTLLENKVGSIVSSNSSLGNQTFESAWTWVKNNKDQKSVIYIEGDNNSITIDETNEATVDLIEIIGRGGVITSLNISNTTSKIVFKSLKITGDVVLSNCVGDVIFEDVIFEFDGVKITASNSVYLNILRSNFTQVNITDFYDYDNFIETTNCGLVDIKECYFSEFASVLVSDSDSSVIFNDNTMASGRAVISGSDRDPLYHDSGFDGYYINCVNSGWVHIKSKSNPNGVNRSYIIKNNSFGYVALKSTTTDFIERFPFININILEKDLIIDSCDITNNTCQTSIIGETPAMLSYRDGYDLIAGIMVSYDADVSSGTNYSKLNCNISNNNFNSYQGIVLSYYSNLASYVNQIDPVFNNINSWLVAGDVNISNNKCGYIGTCLFSGSHAEDTVDMLNVSFADSQSLPEVVNITGNNCRWISTLTAEGRFIFPARYYSDPWSTDLYFLGDDGYWMPAVLASTTISNNNCNWIHIIGGQNTDISDNKLTAWNYGFLGTFYTNNYTGDDQTVAPYSGMTPYVNNSYSLLYGNSHAYALTVLRNINTPKNTNINNNIITGSKTYGSAVDYYAYGLLSPNLSNPIGGGYIQAFGVNLSITNNKCTNFYSSNQYMMDSLISYCAINNVIINNNIIHKMSDKNIWTYIMFAAFNDPNSIELNPPFGQEPQSNTIYSLKGGLTDIWSSIANNEHVFGYQMDGSTGVLGLIANNIFSSTNVQVTDWSTDIGAPAPTTTWTATTATWNPVNVQFINNINWS